MNQKRTQVLVSKPVIALAVGAATIGVGTILFLFDPARFHFYPTCTFHQLTGWHCPGCGCLRATHQLLHGNVKLAFALNPLLILSLPFLLAALVDQIVRVTKGKELFKFPLSVKWLWWLLLVAGVFTVLRNLPAFSWLAP